MSLIDDLSTLALTPLIEAATNALTGDKTVELVVGFLNRHFIDHSQRLGRALEKSNTSAWKSVEIALAGESLWTWLDKAENKAFREQVRSFLETAPLPELRGGGKEFRQSCLQELRAARKDGRLEGPPDVTRLASAAGSFARFGNPDALLDAEWQAIGLMARECREAGYENLGHLLELRTDAKGTPLLVASVRFFFRREIETDSELFQGLTWIKLELLQTSQDQHLTGLAHALSEYAQDVERLLGSVQDVVIDTHNLVLDVQSDILNLAQRFDLLQRELRPRDSFSIGNDSERQLVKQVIARYRALPEEQRQRLPDLLNAIGKLEVATGAFAAAQRDFQQAAILTPDQQARAEAHYNAFGAALEQGDWASALSSIQQAVALHSERFAPFPMGKYEPERILGAGGFGVAFLCRNRHSGSRVVVKTLRSDTLEREMVNVFREANILEELEHPAIIRLRDCDYADPSQTRPYLVMDYFDGSTLGEHVERHGPLSPEDLLALVQPMAEALQLAHARGILHRDIKPANLLVRHDPATRSWRVKLIDFGLALKQNILATSVCSSGPRSIAGYSIAGTIDYAAPEQMGKLPGVAVGPYTDVYGFGKTCCHALFKTVQPLRRHWRDVPEGLADLLEQCLCEEPRERLQSFDKVLERLGKLTARTPTVEPVEDIPTAVPDPPERLPTAIPLPERDSGLGKLFTKAKEQLDKWTGTGLPPEPPKAKPVVDKPKPLPVAKAAPPAAREKTKPPPLPPEAGQPPPVLEIPVLEQYGELGPTAGQQRQREWWRARPDEPAVSVGEVRRLRGHTDGVYSVAFASDGQRLLSGSADGSVRLWNVHTGQELGCLQGHTDKVWNVLFAPDGRHALSASKDKTVRLWDLNRGTELESWAARTNRCVALSADGRLALTGNVSDGMVRLWEMQTGRELRRFKGHMSWVLSVAFHPSGRFALSSSADGTVRVWEVDTGREVRRLQGHKDQVWTAVYTPSGQQVLSCSADRTVRLWDLRSGREVSCFEKYAEQVWSVAVSPDGRFALSDGDQWTVRLWELERGRELPPFQGHGDKVVSVAVAPDGRLAASGSLDKTVIVWALPS